MQSVKEPSAHGCIKRRAQADQRGLPGRGDLRSSAGATRVHDLAGSLRAQPRPTRHHWPRVRSAPPGHRRRALEETQRTKIDRYSTHLFMSAYAAGALDEESNDSGGDRDRRLRHPPRPRSPCATIPHSTSKRWSPAGTTPPTWPSTACRSCLYGLLDYLVDGHFAAVEQRSTRRSKGRDRGRALRPPSGRHRPGPASVVPTAKEPGPPSVDRSCRPVRSSTRCSVTTSTSSGEQMAPYFRDIYMTTSSGRPSGPSRCGTWSPPSWRRTWAEQGNRMNMIMKKVTSWAAIIAVPTAVTGYFGQNVPYPGFGKTWGAASSWRRESSSLRRWGCTCFLFRRKDWASDRSRVSVGSPPPSPRRQAPARPSVRRPGSCAWRG